jgi:hypothetical protein
VEGSGGHRRSSADRCEASHLALQWRLQLSVYSDATPKTRVEHLETGAKQHQYGHVDRTRVCATTRTQALVPSRRLQGTHTFRLYGREIGQVRVLTASVRLLQRRFGNMYSN